MKPYLVHRPIGIFYIRTVENGALRYISTQTRDRNAAEDFLSRYLEGLKPAPTLSVFSVRVVNYAEATLSPRTVEMYKANLERLKKIFEDIPLKDFRKYSSSLCNCLL